MAGILGDSSGDDSWFGNLFSVPETQVQTPAEPSFRTGAPDYSGQSTPETIDQELNWQSVQGGGEGETYTGGITMGGGGGAAAGGEDSLTGYLSKASGSIGSAIDALMKGAKSIFTTEETVQKVRDPATGKLVDKVVGGGMSDFSKLLLQGAISSIGAGQVAKWQEERKEKAAQKVRQHEDAVQAEKYRRTAYGAAPQFSVTKGILGGG